MPFFTHIAHWLQQHQLICPIKKYGNIECPGCGLQRSLAALLQGNWYASWQLHPATPFLLLLPLLALLHFVFKRRLTARLVVACYVLAAVVTLVHYVQKIYTLYIS
jgi:hypothetical protein